MNKFTFPTALLFIIVFTLSGYAQTKTKFGDDVGTLNGIIKAFYASMSVKKGQLPSYERDSLLHFPGALVGFPQIDKSGKTVMRMVTIKQFHTEEDASMAKTGYYEKQIASKVQKFGSLYHVWSTYETRYVAGGPIIGRGIDSIELFYDGNRFWVLSCFYDIERKDRPLPKEYL